jgi:catechol 2,3-dioxygenase-like lactoylglutathione lyase family enzyme
VSLRDAPLLYLFLETSRLARQRELFERLLGLTVIEVEPHLPHHRHGVVKYNAGNIIISLNLTGPSRFRGDESDAITTVYSAGPAWSVERLRGATRAATRDGEELFTDVCGHHVIVTAGGSDVPVVDALRLRVLDLGASVAFYEERLGIELVGRTASSATFATGSVRLVLDRANDAPDGRRPRTSTYLIVFHTPDVRATQEELSRGGVTFRSGKAGYSEIGGTVRFDDPSGHRLCLYEPSAESLTWGSGPKVIEIARGGALSR